MVSYCGAYPDGLLRVREDTKHGRAFPNLRRSNPSVELSHLRRLRRINGNRPTKPVPSRAIELGSGVVEKTCYRLRRRVIGISPNNPVPKSATEDGSGVVVTGCTFRVNVPYVSANPSGEVPLVLTRSTPLGLGLPPPVPVPLMLKLERLTV